MATLEGKYAYQSFTSRMGTMGAVPIPPEILSPWTPPGELQATTDPSGKVSGTLSFPGYSPVVFDFSGSVTPAAGNVLEGVALNGEGAGAVYDIRGFFPADRRSNHIVGTVVAIHNDVGASLRPNGTSGPFYLFPMPPSA